MYIKVAITVRRTPRVFLAPVRPSLTSAPCALLWFSHTCAHTHSPEPSERASQTSCHARTSSLSASARPRLEHCLPWPQHSVQIRQLCSDPGLWPSPSSEADVVSCPGDVPGGRPGLPTVFSRHTSWVCLHLGRPLRSSTFLRSPGQFFCRLSFDVGSSVACSCLMWIVHLWEEYHRSDAVSIDAVAAMSACPLAGPPGFSSVRLLFLVGWTISDLGKILWDPAASSLLRVLTAPCRDGALPLLFHLWIYVWILTWLSGL